MTSEEFAPYMARALQEATANFAQDPNGPMNALVAGLDVFREKLLEELNGTPPEDQVRGFIYLRSVIAAVVAGDLSLAKSFVEIYVREFPFGVFAKAATESVVFPIMSLMVQPMTTSFHCVHCRKVTEFEQVRDRIRACIICKNEIFIRQ